MAMLPGDRREMAGDGAVGAARPGERGQIGGNDLGERGSGSSPLPQHQSWNWRQSLA
ncbi:hypothetical protein [Novosphingobium resinovorum]|uniref:hypothetical protein n=1 Tax=Novosphingobium resinovorum TaxID=158500 RepID=UPI003D2B9741